MPEMLCRTCSAPDKPHYCPRVTTTFEVGGKPLPEPKDECEHCGTAQPDAANVVDGSRLWLMEDVVPNEYEVRNGQKVIKDWAAAELEQRIANQKSPEQEAEERALKRQRERHRYMQSIGKTSLTQTEIDQICRAVREGALNADLQELGIVVPR